MEPPNWLKDFIYSKEIISQEIGLTFLRSLLSTGSPEDLDKISPFIETRTVHPALKIEKITKNINCSEGKPHPLISAKTLRGHKQRGIFAESFIPKGTELGEYVGEVFLRNIEADISDILSFCSEYTWQVKVKDFMLITDPKKWANELAFINDYRGIKESPNVASGLIIHRGAFHFGYITIADIEAKEELLVDYGERYWKAFIPKQPQKSAKGRVQSA